MHSTSRAKIAHRRKASVRQLRRARVAGLTGGDSKLLMISGAAFSASLVACVRIRHVIVLAILLVPAGMAWLWVLMSATGALQVFLPGWVRARGLSTFNIVFAGGQAIRAFFWGLLAQWVGFVPAFIAAAAVMALSTVTVAVWPLHDVSGLNRDLAVVPLPELAREPAPEEGPVLVILRYIVEERHIPVFREAMELVRHSRQRTGATRCDLCQDGDGSVRVHARIGLTHLRRASAPSHRSHDWGGSAVSRRRSGTRGWSTRGEAPVRPVDTRSMTVMIDTSLLYV
jgi:hypothetical protein